MEYASNGKGNAALTLGIIGSGLGALNGGLGNVLGGIGGCNNSCSNSYNMEFIDVKTENAILKSELNTERKIVDIYNDLGGRINDLTTKVDSNAAAQAVINCGMNSATAVLQSQVAQLMGMTKLSIPNSAVCPGWGSVTLTTITDSTAG